MIKIPLVTKTYKKLRRGEVKLAHAPNGALCWVSKNMAGEIRWFDANVEIPRIVRKFSVGESNRY